MAYLERHCVRLDDRSAPAPRPANQDIQRQICHFGHLPILSSKPILFLARVLPSHNDSSGLTFICIGNFDDAEIVIQGQKYYFSYNGENY